VRRAGRALPMSALASRQKRYARGPVWRGQPHGPWLIPRLRRCRGWDAAANLACNNFIALLTAVLVPTVPTVP
jgi:hypothetical protein